MNHPVGNRYGDRLMPLDPNSRSEGSTPDGSIEVSETVSVTTSSFWSFALADRRTAALTLTALSKTLVYFYYFKH
jgi:hypothetical protein